jgi:hypothetical protein
VGLEIETSCFLSLLSWFLVCGGMNRNQMLTALLYNPRDSDHRIVGKQEGRYHRTSTGSMSGMRESWKMFEPASERNARVYEAQAFSFPGKKMIDCISAVC